MAGTQVTESSSSAAQSMLTWWFLPSLCKRVAFINVVKDEGKFDSYRVEIFDSELGSIKFNVFIRDHLNYMILNCVGTTKKPSKGKPAQMGVFMNDEFVAEKMKIEKQRTVNSPEPSVLGEK